MIRRKEREDSIARGLPPPEYNDALDWRVMVLPSLGRMTMEETTVLQKGSIISVGASEMVFRDKQKFVELTTTPLEHLAFGHGMYACSGGFFTANEVKITIIGNLMKYEIELGEGSVLTNLRYRVLDLKIKLGICRREEVSF
ncbi:hypothetical protein F4679DRAFT_590197 [Xylaria curta]|nr:hypothetical protein F4679DRAFT_590197 [Xylaria curta]